MIRKFVLLLLPVLLLVNACAGLPGIKIETDAKKECSPYTIKASAYDTTSKRSLLDEDHVVASGYFLRYLSFPQGHVVEVKVTVLAARPCIDGAYIRLSVGGKAKTAESAKRATWSNEITTS
jgi:hypothetical protein